MVVCVETLVKMGGVPESILELLIEKGYFKTKTEVLRAGVLNLGEKYGVLKDPEELEKNLVALKIKKEEQALKKAGKGNISEKEVKKKYGFK